MRAWELRSFRRIPGRYAWRESLTCRFATRMRSPRFISLFASAIATLICVDYWLNCAISRGFVKWVEYRSGFVLRSKLGKHSNQDVVLVPEMMFKRRDNVRGGDRNQYVAQ